jgi:ribonuclease T1
MIKKIIPALLLLIILGFLAARFYTKDRIKPTQETNFNQNDQVNQVSSQSHEDELRSNAKIPQKVYRVLKYIKQHNEAPQGYIGGREFKNREKRLRQKTSEGRRIKYREWDVNPKSQGRNRGRERLVTGDDETSWYTADHYNTFTEIK